MINSTMNCPQVLGTWELELLFFILFYYYYKEAISKWITIFGLSSSFSVFHWYIYHISFYLFLFLFFFIVITELRKLWVALTRRDKIIKPIIKLCSPKKPPAIHIILFQQMPTILKIAWPMQSPKVETSQIKSNRWTQRESLWEL